jgi:hypothetical protein
MSFQLSILGNILRLMTPEKISELTTSSSGKKKAELTDVLLKDLSGSEILDDNGDVLSEGEEEEKAPVYEAKILPLDGSGANEDLEIECGGVVIGLMKEFVEECKKMEKNLLGAKRKVKRKGGSQKKGTSSFILEEKKKMEASYFNLKGKEILNLYQKNSEFDIEQQKNNKDDLLKASQLGILINKKQA